MAVNAKKRLRSVLDHLRTIQQRNLQRALKVREKLRLSEEASHLVLAAGVGIIGGLANFIFYIGVEWVKLFTLRRPGDGAEVAEMFSWWQRMLVPMLGGLAAGLVLYWGLRLTRQSSTNLLEVVVAGDGRLKFGPGLVRAISSLLSIATGASIGREGAITQITATISSKLGQLRRWQPYRLRLLVGCGAAAGMAAAYNAPIAGAVFAAQIVLGNFSMNYFAPLVVASVAATVVSRTIFGIAPWYSVPGFEITSVGDLGWFVLLGLVCGAGGAMFLKLISESETLFGRIPLPLYGRLAVGGCLVGAIAVGYPEVWGNGYGATNRVLHHSLPLHFVLGLLLAKLMATLAAVGVGTVGGVFTPTLFLGAGVGAAFGSVLHGAGVATGLPLHTFALVGMGSLLAATVHSPLLAVILMFEISLNYSLMPPLMLACAVATLVARQLHPDSIYTAPLKARGIEADRDNITLGAAQQQKIGDLMRTPVPPVRENATLPEIAAVFLSTTYYHLPVVEENGRLIGLVSLHDVKEHLSAAQSLRAVIASDILLPVKVVLTPNQLLIDALPLLLASEQRNIPVVNGLAEHKLVGAVSRAEALGLLSEAIAVSNTGPKLTK